MQRMFEYIEKNWLGTFNKIGSQRHLRAVRDGIVATMPLVMLGSFFVMLATFPIPAWQNLIEPHVGTIMIPFRLTVGLTALYASYGIGQALAKYYRLDEVSGGMLALGAFLTTQLPTIAIDAETSAELGFVLPLGPLGGQGLFTAIIAALFAVEVLRICQEKKVIIRLPEQVPSAVARSFEAIIPGAVTITTLWLIRHVFNFDIQQALESLFSPLVTIAGNSYLGVLLPVFFICLLWASGIHGVSVIGAVMRPVWVILLDENIHAAAEGLPIPNIGTEGFFDLFVWIGGSGGTLALCLLMMASKSEYVKQIGRLSLMPGIFNINEPVIFGAPIVLNPVLAIPFIVAPLVTTTITYIVMKLEWVARVSVVTPFAIPAPIKAYISTNGDWRAVLLVLVNFAVSLLIYYPFVKVYDRQQLAKEQTPATE